MGPRRIEHRGPDGSRLTELESAARLVIRHPFSRRSLVVSGLVNALLATACVVGAVADWIDRGPSALMIATTLLGIWFAVRSVANWLVLASMPGASTPDAGKPSIHSDTGVTPD